MGRYRLGIRRKFFTTKEHDSQRSYGCPTPEDLEVSKDTLDWVLNHLVCWKVPLPMMWELEQDDPLCSLPTWTFLCI